MNSAGDSGAIEGNNETLTDKLVTVNFSLQRLKNSFSK